MELECGPNNLKGHHECKLFVRRGQQEAAESDWKWKSCTKNPGHEKFLSALDFKTIYLPKVQNDGDRELFRSRIDLTVRLRVQLTSTKRPDDDEFSQCRGSDQLRTGTGFIHHVYPPRFNMFCLCCKKTTKKHWSFWVRTAHHVVFNTEEAKKTKVDLFLDDENCERDGGMKSVWGVERHACYPEKDWCDILWCVTCDEDIGQRIESAYHCFNKRRHDQTLTPSRSVWPRLSTVS